MYAYFVAIVFIFELATSPPQMVEPHLTLDGCLSSVLEYNNKDKDIYTPENFKRGMHYVCLKIVLGV